MTKNQKGREIKLKFSRRNLKRYLQKFNFLIDQKLDNTNIEAVLLQVINDYKVGSMSLDELSSISNYLWSLIPESERFGSKLANVLYLGAELFYYERQIQDSEDAGNILASSIKEVLNYKL